MHRSTAPSTVRAALVMAAGSCATLLACPPMTGGSEDPAWTRVSVSAAAVRGGEACRLAAEAQAAAEGAGRVDLAICLDTSGSMNGLIDSARAKIWDIVSDLATAKPAPKLRVALLTYGNDGLTQENGWTNVEADLTEDLDTVSQKLFALTTNGGTEYVGRVVDRATKALTWTPGDKALKIIVVAGNESADQDQQVKYQEASRRAIEKGILVNSIYCGPIGDNLAPAWKEVSQLADGQFAAIDQDKGTVIVQTPFDDQLLSLNGALNATYVPYGDRGEWGAGNQVRQDANAVGVSSAVAAQRCTAKGSSCYSNSQWDLVDASAAADFKLESVEAKDLPEAMRSMSVDERRAYVESRRQERARVQKEIQEVSAKRARFVAEETARMGGDAGAFDRAFRTAVRAQAQARGFAFPVDAQPAPQPAPAAPAAAGAVSGRSNGGC